METAIDGNGKRSARRQRAYLGIAVSRVVVVGAAWVVIDRSGGNDKSQRSGALVTGNAVYTNVVTVGSVPTDVWLAGINTTLGRISPLGVAVDSGKNV